MDWLFKALSSWLINRLKNLVACESGPRLEPIAEQFPHSYTKRLSKRVLVRKKRLSSPIWIKFQKKSRSVGVHGETKGTVSF